jgi:hypothetical protein
MQSTTQTAPQPKAQIPALPKQLNRHQLESCLRALEFSAEHNGTYSALQWQTRQHIRALLRGGDAA